MSSSHPFHSDPRLQGRVEPPGAPAVEGSNALCLGAASPGHKVVTGETTYEVFQWGNAGTPAAIVRAVVRVGHIAPTGGQWTIQAALAQPGATYSLFEQNPSRPRTFTDVAMITGDLVGDMWMGFRLLYVPDGAPDEVELPGIFIDGLTLAEDSGITLGNRVPSPGELDVEADTFIDLHIMSPAGPNPTAAATQIWVNGVLAYSAGVFQPGFNGVNSYTFTASSGRALCVRIDPTVVFASQEVVTVRVVSNEAGGTLPLDASYTFTIEDTTAPIVLSATGEGLKTVNVLFNEPMLATNPTDGGDALNPANYVLTRQTAPAVNAVVTAVSFLTSFEVQLETDIPLTPGATYLLTVSNAEDVNGNVIEAPFNQATFTAWRPPVPDGRSVEIYRMLPWANREEDETRDLLKFCLCLQEVLDLLLWDIDKWSDILDPDLCPEEYLDHMLYELGNPFSFPLEETDKRRLIQVLVSIYRLKGTAVGIQNAVNFFLGIPIEFDIYSNGDTMILGESELGVNWTLGAGEQFLLYSFRVLVAQVLTDEQRMRIRDIVNYMKPAHTHLVAIVEPTPPVIIDHLELGASELGGDEWILH